MAIPTTIVRNLEQNGILRTMAIDLSDNVEDRAAIIEVLRSKLYSDKTLAPIREYATNAMDSHVEAGCPNEPIKVTLPTQIVPEFRVRDFGIGLTPDEVEKIYIKYGRSTKRNTNGQTGQLGLGCKSAFAYGDNFLVTSHKDGVKTTYNLTINGVCTIIAAEPMEIGERNGIEVVVPVNMDDIKDFQNKAVDFFKYWKICPELKGGDVSRIDALREELAKKPLFSADDWEIRPNQNSYSYSDKGVAVMGNVPYPINWDILANKLNLRSGDEKNEVLYAFIRSNRTILRFDIGDLDFSASRESLEYTDKTCNMIIGKIRSILDSIFKILNDKIATAKSYWDALTVYNQIFGRDEDKLFHGDVYRLEKYYQGKFAWNGIEIKSGAFEHIEYWDTVLGYSADGNWKNSSGLSISGDNPILTIFENRNGRVKQYHPNAYSNNRIPASNRIKIVIHDLESNTLTKSSARYILNHPDQNGKTPSKVYFLKFSGSAQQKEFFKVMHFDSVPVVFVSQIIDKVKAWLKSSRMPRVSGGNTTGVRNTQSVKCFSPKSRLNKYGYYDDATWLSNDIDPHEYEGFYIELFGGTININGKEVSGLSNISHHAFTLFTVLNKAVDYVYGLPEKNRSAKWFSEAEEDGQWVKLEKFFKDNEDQIIRGKGVTLANAMKYFDNQSNEGFIGINFATKVLPLLKNKNGAMYKFCSNVSQDFRKSSDLINALKFFGLTSSLEGASNVNFEQLATDLDKNYPMIYEMESLRYIRSNEPNYVVNDEKVQMIADYINMVDSTKV